MTNTPHIRRTRRRGMAALPLILAALLVGAFVPSTASSQGWGDRDAFFGSGTLRFRGRTSSIIRLGVRRNGNLVNIRLRTQSGEVHVLDGRFRRDVTGGYETEVHLLDDEEASGVLNVGTRGSGLLELGNRPRQRLTMAAVSTRRDGTAEIKLTQTNGGVISLGGRVSRRDAYTVRISLTSSGEADASGFANISYGANGRINSLSIDGHLDGQGMTVYFAP